MKNLNKHTDRYLQLIQLAIIGMFILFIASCQKNTETEEPEGDKRGDLIESTYLMSYTTGFIQSIINSADVDINAEVKYGVDVYKLLYYTPGPDGSLIEASGAIMIPKDAIDLPELAYFHGTETKRIQVASYNPVGTYDGLIGLVAASIGFATLLPDYLGLGDSYILHPYIHAALSGGTALDMIRAGNTFSIENDIILNGDLYLSGYSEGGFVALASQKTIEEESSFDFNIVACAPQAGPYDVYETALYMMNLEEYPEPTNISYILTAYDDVYGWNRLTEIFNAPYAEKMPGLFDGTLTNSEIKSQLTTNVKELIKEEFLDGLLDGTEKDFLDAFKENSLLSWKPDAPIRFYHSNGDEVVPYQNMLTAAQKLKENGATKIETVTIEGMKHGDAGLPAITMMIDWFDSLRIAR